MARGGWISICRTPSLDKAAVEAALNALIAADLPVGAEWIADEELASRPDLVRTLSVKPPMGAGTGAPAAHRRRCEHGRSPALRRHPCRAHRRDRPGRHRQDRKQGPPQPAGEPAAWRNRAGRTGLSPFAQIEITTFRLCKLLCGNGFFAGISHKERAHPRLAGRKSLFDNRLAQRLVSPRPPSRGPESHDGR